MKHRQNKPTGPDRRRILPRKDVAIACRVAIGNDQHQSYITKNISAGGLCILVKQQLKVDTIISLEINIPDNKPSIVAKGRVAWTHKFEFGTKDGDRYGLGVEFTEIANNDRQRIFDYIAL